MSKKKRKKRKSRLKISVQKIKEILNSKIPKIRTGVQNTKVIPDKTKYSRKEKHKKDLRSEE